MKKLEKKQYIKKISIRKYFKAQNLGIKKWKKMILTNKNNNVKLYLISIF